MASNLKITAIIQVRLNSMRLPEKAMKLINGKPLIQILIDRLSFSKEINNILIATSKNYKNKKLVKYLQAKDMEVFEGSENNVLKRYYEAAKNNNSKIIVRITGDSPLVDSKLLDNFLKIFKRKKLDYLNNTYPPTFPDGLDIEVFTFKALKKTYQLAKDKYDKEHVTPFMQNSKIFKKINIKSKIDFSKIRLTVDEKEDIDVIELILNYFNPKINFNLGDIINLYNKKPNIFKKNSKIIRNEGANLNKNQKLWKRAKKIIPGGNMLLSKRPELFLPGKWPTYFSKAKNCTVWDLEGKKYLDTCLMGVGTNILGYCNSSVDNAVKKAIKKRNIFHFKL
jgi:spore coat polysaccharide biosynthesis protein SpsF (cytidylyltransferase family)